MMFHFQVGGSSQAAALLMTQKLMSEIVPMVERQLGRLASIGAPIAGALTQ